MADRGGQQPVEGLGVLVDGLDEEVFQRLRLLGHDPARELAAVRRRWGCPRLTDWLRREGFSDNHKRIERIYREEQLQVRRRKRKRQP